MDKAGRAVKSDLKRLQEAANIHAPFPGAAVLPRSAMCPNQHKLALQNFLPLFSTIEWRHTMIFVSAMNETQRS